MDHVGILVLSTTRGRDFKTLKDTYLVNIFFSSFLQTYSKDYKYTIYIGYDTDDPLYSNSENRLEGKIKDHDKIEVRFVELINMERGWVTKMWNHLADVAKKDGCYYLYQCGDDVQFLNKDWVEKSVNALKAHDNIGLSGPIDYGRLVMGGDVCKPGGERFIMTQSFVSIKHLEMFGSFFPVAIKNWLCDDYITEVYKPDYLYVFDDCYILNKGGDERYVPIINEELVKIQKDISNIHKNKLIKNVV